jgi:hypothetical protein
MLLVKYHHRLNRPMRSIPPAVSGCPEKESVTVATRSKTKVHWSFMELLEDGRVRARRSSMLGTSMFGHSRRARNASWSSRLRSQVSSPS